MAYDRYDTRRSRYPEYDRERARHEDRGFFERAGDEIASWFGDDEAERRRREDERMNPGGGRERNFDRDRERYRYGGWGEPERDRYANRGSNRDFDRGRFEDEDRSSRPMNWSSSERDYRSGYGGYDRDFSGRAGGGFEPMSRSGYSGGYGYTGSTGYGAGSDRGYGSGGWGGAFTGSDYERRDSERDRFSGAGRETDRHYEAWRQRQLNELDRDYDEYRRENQERFASDFGSWRQNRQQKRGMLGQIREHMDVVGSDGETIGKVDKVRGDHVILTKSDSEDNRHHAIKCTMIDTVEGDQVRLDIPAEEAKSRFRDEDERGFFGREDEGERTTLERSFSGTYER